MRSLNHAWAKARREGKTFPAERWAQVSLQGLCVVAPRLWIQGDNAPKEVRNVAMAKWAIALVQGSYFKTVSECFLEVGHTHEDVGLVLLTFLSDTCADATLSVVRAAIASTVDLQTPRDIGRNICCNP